MSLLPPNQQFLITRKVPCRKRIKELESAASGIQEVEIGDGWVEANDTSEAPQEAFDLNAQVVSAEEEKDEAAVDLDDLMAEDAGGDIFD